MSIGICDMASPVHCVSRLSCATLRHKTEPYGTGIVWQDAGKRVDTRTLHGHHRTLLLLPPGAQSDQGTVGGTTVDQLYRDLALVTDPTQTGRQRRRLPSATATDRGSVCLGRLSST